MYILKIIYGDKGTYYDSIVDGKSGAIPDSTPIRFLSCVTRFPFKFLAKLRIKVIMKEFEKTGVKLPQFIIQKI